MEQKRLKDINLVSALSNGLAKMPLYYLDGIEWVEIMTEERVITYAKNIYFDNLREDYDFPHDIFNKSPNTIEESVRLIKWVDEELFKITD